MVSIWRYCRRESHVITFIESELGQKLKWLRIYDNLKFFKIIVWKYSDIWIWPNWWPGVTRIEVLSSYNSIPGFPGGTVRHTAVTKMEKLDGVGPVDNRPSTNKLHHFVPPQKKVTCDTWLVTWHVTHDMWHVWRVEHSLKISAP